MEEGQSLRITCNIESPDTARVIGDKYRPVKLNDGRYLRAYVSLRLEHDPKEKITKLRVYNSSFQYQHDPDERRWIVRYDYTRNQPKHHPASHLQVFADLAHSCLPEGKPFQRIHLPTGRLSIEAVIRLLADQFDIRCNTEAAVWRPILAEAERHFNRIAHKPISGPDN